MTFETDIENLGVPDIEIAGLKIWVHSRRFPDQQDFWDGNWLNSTVRCSAEGASVLFSSDFLRNAEISEWLTALEKLNKTFTGGAEFVPTQNCINIKIAAETYQRISVKVDIYPKGIHQKHYFEYWLDRNHLNDLISSCRKILTKFPIRRKTS